MSRYQEVFNFNAQWLADKKQKKADFFEHLASGQSPEFLYIGCADSRVSVTDITGLEPGEVFVHRNVANLVVNTDLNIHSVIDYAVNHLGVKHIVVCGHYGCGGVQAAMGDQELGGVLDGWLREIRDVFRLHSEHLLSITDTDERYRELIRLNVQEQCNNLLKIPSVQKKQPEVHGWVFDLATGSLEDLHFQPEPKASSFSKIYTINN